MLGLLLRLGNGAGQVAAADAELDRDQASRLFPIDHRGAGPFEIAAEVHGAIIAFGADHVAEPQVRGVAERIGGGGQGAADGGRGLAGPGRRRGEPRGPAADTWLLPTSMGMLRMDDSLCRRDSGQRMETSKNFSPSIISVKGLPPSRCPPRC